MNQMILLASLVVLFLLPFQTLSMRQGVSAEDKRFEAYLSLGCWKDECMNKDCSKRVLENLETKATYGGKGKSIFYNGTHGYHYKRRPDAVNACMKAAIDFGYAIFAVQDGGQCFSGPNAGKVYKTEKSKECIGLKGGPLVNDVFTLSPLKKCLCMMPKTYRALPKGKTCFKSEKDINANKRTPLHVAARNGDTDCTKILVNSQANIEAKDKDNATPLKLAAYGKSIDRDGSQCGPINILVTMNASQANADQASIKACLAEKPTAHASSSGAPYNHLGCWKDQHPNRALPTIEGNAEVKSILTGHYKRRFDALGKCMRAAKKLGFNVFAVQDGGQCFAAKDAKVTAMRYGKSNECDAKSGKGGPLANDLYELN